MIHLVYHKKKIKIKLFLIKRNKCNSMALIIWANNVLQIIKINNLNINNLKN